MSKGLLKGLFHQLLLVDVIRYFVAFGRYLYFAKIRRKLRTLDTHSDHVSENTIFHNLKGVKAHGSRRSFILLKPLSSIESLGADSSVLAIGPRSEGELLGIIAYGFMPGKVRGLDLISYSPWVDLGDMHAMPYEDDSWDAIIMGWVISYSDAPEKAAEEVIRVARPGAVISIGVEHHPLSQAELKQETGYMAGSARRLRSVREILGLFGDHVDRVYFSHDILPDRQALKGSVCAIFSLKK